MFLPLLFLLFFSSLALGNSVTVSVGSSNPSAGTHTSGDTNVPVLQIRLTPATTATHRVSAVSFTAQGTLPDHTGITAVRLYEDVNGNGSYDTGTDVQIGSAGSYSFDNGAVTFSGFYRYFYSGASQDWLLVYDLSASAPSGDTFRAGIAQTSHVTAQYRSG
jgi:hypothetical protein